MSEDTLQSQDVCVESLFGFHTRQPLVQMRLGVERVQMSPQEAREIAASLLEAAECAQTDAFLFEFMGVRIGSTVEAAAGVLKEFRAWRDKRAAAQEAES